MEEDKITGWKSPVLNSSISIFSSVDRNLDTLRSYDQSKYTNIGNKIRENKVFHCKQSHELLYR